MKRPTLTVVITALSASLALTACSSEGEDTTASTTESETTTAEAAPVTELPTAAELNEILLIAADPNAPMEDRIRTVQGGETVDPSLFDTMTLAQQESGANFQVVDPVYPGYTLDSVLATVTFTLPEQEPQIADDVEFIYEDDTWKLSQAWACILINNTVTPEQVPAMCLENPAPAPAPEAEVPAEEAPVEEAPAEAPVEEAPAEAPVEEVPVQ